MKNILCALLISSSGLSLVSSSVQCDEIRPFSCDNICIPNSFLCDDERDCTDGSDEDVTMCAKMRCGFQCGNRRCIPGLWQCDGKKDCSDGEDEEHCEGRREENPNGTTGGEKDPYETDEDESFKGSNNKETDFKGDTYTAATQDESKEVDSQSEESFRGSNNKTETPKYATDVIATKGDNFSSNGISTGPTTDKKSPKSENNEAEIGFQINKTVATTTIINNSNEVMNITPTNLGREAGGINSASVSSKFAGCLSKKPIDAYVMTLLMTLIYSST